MRKPERHGLGGSMRRFRGNGLRSCSDGGTGRRMREPRDPFDPAAHRIRLALLAYVRAEPGLRVHYTDEGNREGRTLILVHGFAASVHAWRPWIERLAPDYRLIAIDLPGHGLTEAPAGYKASLEGNAALVDALANETGVRRFVLAGNSMGGAVSLCLRDGAWRSARWACASRCRRLARQGWQGRGQTAMVRRAVQQRLGRWIT